MFPGVVNNGGTTHRSKTWSCLSAQDCLLVAQIRLGSSVRVRYRLRYVGQGLEYVPDPAWFIAGTDVPVQECFWGA